MKFLIIENGQAKYTVSPNEPASTKVDELSKEDLLKLIELCMTDDTFEMDSYDENLLQNKAHQIIYKNIFQKLDDLRKQRIRFSDEQTVLYRAAISKYSADLLEDTDN